MYLRTVMRVHVVHYFPPSWWISVGSYPTQRLIWITVLNSIEILPVEQNPWLSHSLNLFKILQLQNELLQCLEPKVTGVLIHDSLRSGTEDAQACMTWCLTLKWAGTPHIYSDRYFVVLHMLSTYWIPYRRDFELRMLSSLWLSKLLSLRAAQCITLCIFF